MPAIFMLQAFDSLVIACCVTHLSFGTFVVNRETWDDKRENLEVTLTFSFDVFTRSFVRYSARKV